jgi:hypothetical protein
MASPIPRRSSNQANILPLPIACFATGKGLG